VPLNAEQRRARAQLAAERRWRGEHAELTDEAAALEQAALDRHIAELVASWPRMTPEQRDRIGRVFRYGPAPEGGATG
jgi:hypothetical protein